MSATARAAIKYRLNGWLAAKKSGWRRGICLENARDTSAKYMKYRRLLVKRRKKKASI